MVKRPATGVGVAVAVVLLLAVSAAVVVAGTDGGATRTVHAGSARSASVAAHELEERSPTTTGAPAPAVSTAPPAAGGGATPASRPKATTTTTASPVRPAATTSTTAKAAGGVDGPGVYVVAPDGTGVRKVVSGWGIFSWSPDGSKLAVADGRTLRIAAADGSRQTEIAAGAGATAPVWSPDGSRIAFGRSGSEWVIGVDGSGAARLAEPQSHLAGWTPDGRLVLITDPQGGWSSVVIHEKDGTRRVIASDASTTVQPVISPDGRMVAYLGNGITVAAVDGSGSRSITPVCCGSESVGSPLAWSPDSRRVAYIHNGNVRVAAADGSGDRVLVAKATSPAWSSDGRLVVIDESATRADGLLHLTLQLIGAGDERRPVLDAGPTLSVVAPQWSPDGRLIAVAVIAGGTVFR